MSNSFSLLITAITYISSARAPGVVSGALVNLTPFAAFH